MDARLFAGWMPVRLFWQGREPMAEWRHLGEADFTEPFFEQTIARVMRRPFNLLFHRQTPIGALEEINSTLPHLKPDGFIFHMSRCGSTVVSRMLAALPENLILSEPRLLDFIFHGRRGVEPVSDEVRMFWLRAVIGALAQQRHPGKKRFMLKFDSWHTLHLALIRRAFPEVPCVFVYREPLEVLVSHQRQAAGQMMPDRVNPHWIGLEPAAVAGMTGEEFCARMLAAICRAALDEASRGAMMFIHYRQLPEVVASAVAPFFKLETPAQASARMLETARFNAKEPSVLFTPDAEDKQREASELLKQMSEQWVMPGYEKLEALRQRQFA